MIASALLDLPSGAVIVLTMAALAGVYAAICRPRKSAHAQGVAIDDV
jgi:hypothetical protein